MKKILALLLTLCMTVGLLAGCGGGSGDSQPAQSNQPSGGQPANQPSGGESADGAWKMTMEIINYGFNDPDLQMVQDAVNAITVPEIGVEVEFLPVPIMNMATKLGLMVAGGEKIDLTVAGLLTTPSRLVSDGLLQPITQYVESSDALMKLADGVLDACRINGEIYAYPGSTANGVQVRFFYNKDLADQYNIQVPDPLDTPEKWTAMFEQIKASGMDAYGISLGDGVACEYEWNEFDGLGDDNSCTWGVIMGNDTTDTVVNYFATPEYKAKCEQHRVWWQSGYAVPDSNSNGYTTTDSVTQGMSFSQVSNGGTGMNDAYWTKITGHNIASVAMGKVNTYSANVINFCWGVSSSCEHPEKAVQFLELLYTNTELANIMNYGIEGTHYVTTPGSMIIDYPEGIDAGSCGYGSFVGTYGDVSKTYQRAPLTDEFVASIPSYMYPNAPVSKYLGFTFDQSPVSTELTAVTAVISQYAPPLDCGIVDPDTVIPEFLNALESAGMSKVIAETQNQLDTWLAAQ